MPTLLGIKICSSKIAAPKFQERERERDRERETERERREIANSFTVFLEK